MNKNVKIIYYKNSQQSKNKVDPPPHKGHLWMTDSQHTQCWRRESCIPKIRNEARRLPPLFTFTLEVLDSSTNQGKEIKMHEDWRRRSTSVLFNMITYAQKLNQSKSIYYLPTYLSTYLPTYLSIISQSIRTNKWI